MEYSKKEHERMMKAMQYFHILLKETMIPYSLQRDYHEEFKDFEIFEAFACLEDEVKTVSETTLIHDTLLDNPIVFMTEHELKELLTSFLAFVENNDDTDVDSLVEKYIKELE